MGFEILSLGALMDHGYDDVIDVRSPSEFAEDHLPGAINLPALDDTERAEVGTIYKQVSPFDARKIGAAKVARNVADYLDGPLSDRDGGWRPLVYCWRGGQRSGSVATILNAVGWRADTVIGGYQSYRRAVVSMLYDHALPHRIIRIDGNTGTGKTELLQHLAGQGCQILDLEALANHRGSLLGARPDGQPSQKSFESRLAAALTACDPAHPIIVEAESSKIGGCSLPPRVWQAMREAPRIELVASSQVRARYLARTYRDVIGAPGELCDRLNNFRRLRGANTVDAWIELAKNEDFEDLALQMITTHYDPAYSKSRGRGDLAVLGQFDMGDLSESAISGIAARISDLVNLPTT